MNIVSIVGARPQFVKAAVVSRQIRARRGWREQIIHTGQHYDENMSDIFFRELGIPVPAFFLRVGSDSHGAQTAKMIAGIEKILLAERPDWLIVYGDTNSTLAGALAAAKLHTPIAHVEAGLRSFNRRMPEEINRLLTDHASDLLLAPTETAVGHLRHEGIDHRRIRLVGDVMYDAVLYYRDQADSSSDVMSRLELYPKRFLLATVHRPENTDHVHRLRAIVEGLIGVGQTLPVILPLHPRTRQALEQHDLLEAASKSLTLIDPVGYLDMINLQSNAAIVVTDSGGMQKESFFCRTPCVTLRDETEWVELVELGWNELLTPNDPTKIAAVLLDVLCRTPPAASQLSPYGNGNSAQLVCDALAEAQPLSKVA